MDQKKFRKLQLKWYRKARKSGFKDIEGTSDFNDFPVSTFRSSGGTTHLAWDFSRDDELGENALLGWDGVSGLGESAQWEYYSRIGDYAETLLDGDETRKVLLAFLARKSRVEPVRVPGMRYATALSIWNEAIKKLGLPPESTPRTPRDKPLPGPVKHLSKKEIKALDYTPPKKLK